MTDIVCDGCKAYVAGATEEELRAKRCSDCNDKKES